jgi:Aspartyl protease
MPARFRNSVFIRHAKLFALPILIAASATTEIPVSAQSTSAAYNGVKFLTEVPLLDCKGTPCIEVRINDGAPVKFVIDTGNVDSVIDAKVMKSADLQPLHPPKPGGAPIELIPTRIPELHIGSMALTQVIAAGMDLTDMINQNQMPDVAGSLAYPAFQDRIIQLDFVANKFRISDVLKSPVKCAGKCDTISLITFGKEGPPIVVADGFEINTVKVTAQLDTMFTGSMLVYTASIDKLSLTGAASTTDTRLFPLTDGGVNMRVADASEEGFQGITLAKEGAKVYFPTETVHEPDGLFDATVGLELFRDTILTLDFHDMTLSLDKPAKQ